MPRAEVGTPKWLANKMKAKGLQRLRWYCQMCEKQCRDENGFKCHRMSEGHQRQMQIFMQRANRYMDDFSREFEATFMQLMRTRYCRTRVLANTVYCELIADKTHIHMNATRWSTLSEFVLYLKRSGKCTAEYSEQGWYLEFIDREKIAREEREAAQRKTEISAEQRRERVLKRKIEEAWKNKGPAAEASECDQVKPFERPTEEAETSRILIQLPAKTARSTASRSVRDTPQSSSLLPPDLLKPDAFKYPSNDEAPKVEQKHTSALDRLMSENEKRKRAESCKPGAVLSGKLSSGCQSNSISSKRPVPSVSPNSESEAFEDEPWLVKGLIVRVMTKDFADGRYYRAKGCVDEVVDLYVGKLTLLDSRDVVLLDQAMLEPVIPGTGGYVLVIRGEMKGSLGRIVDVDLVSTSAEVELDGLALSYGFDDTGPQRKRQRFDFNDICKVKTQ